MDTYKIQCGIDELVKESLRNHLTIVNYWVGDPKTSVFGVMVQINWDGQYICDTVIDFISKE